MFRFQPITSRHVRQFSNSNPSESYKYFIKFYYIQLNEQKLVRQNVRVEVERQSRCLVELSLASAKVLDILQFKFVIANRRFELDVLWGWRYRRIKGHLGAIELRQKIQW